MFDLSSFYLLFLKILKSLHLRNGIVDINITIGNKFSHHSILPIIKFLMTQIEANKKMMLKIFKLLILILFVCLTAISIYAYLSPLPPNQVEIIESIKLDEN